MRKELALLAVVFLLSAAYAIHAYRMAGLWAVLLFVGFFVASFLYRHRTK